jgi:phosphate-selective porin OprO and OprP
VRRGVTRPVREVENTGWNLSAGYVLTGEDSAYRGVTPKTVFNPTAGTWGAFEVVARVARLDIDDVVFDGSAATRLADPSVSVTDITTYGIGLNWYPAKAVRLGLNYFHNEFEADDSGSPASNAVIGGDEQTIIGRVQVSF